MIKNSKIKYIQDFLAIKHAALVQEKGALILVDYYGNRTQMHFSEGD